MAFAALRCVVAAAQGNEAASLALAIAVEAGLDDEADPLLRMRVHQRLALAAFYRKESEAALRHADASVALARANGARRSAAGAHSVAYMTHYGLTGDLVAAQRYAREIVIEATAAGDRSVRALGLVAQYEISVELADDAAAHATSGSRRAPVTPSRETR